MSSLTPEQVVGFKKVDSLSDVLSYVTDSHVGVLYPTTSTDHRSLFGEALSALFASPDLHHPQISDRCAHLGCDCFGVVPVLALWICIHVLSDPEQLEPGSTWTLWQLRDIHCNRTYSLGADRFCYPFRTYTRG